MREPNRDAVLVVGFRSASGGMATRLISLGYRPISVSDPAAGALRLGREPEPVRAAVVPADAPFLGAGALRGLTRASGDGALRCLAVGPPTDEAGQEALRLAGVHFTLFEPCSDRELRFALNRALHDRARGHGRLHPRVATDLVARVRVGTREKAGLVYALSVAGCYVETERPCMAGSLVAVHLPLPGGPVDAAARVTFANVPGDFARSKLPRGMALEFVELGSAQHSVVSAYVAQRIAQEGPAAEAAPADAPRFARVWAGLRRIARPFAATRATS